MNWRSIRHKAMRCRCHRRSNRLDTAGWAACTSRTSPAEHNSRARCTEHMEWRGPRPRPTSRQSTERTSRCKSQHVVLECTSRESGTERTAWTDPSHDRPSLHCKRRSWLIPPQHTYQLRSGCMDWQGWSCDTRQHTGERCRVQQRRWRQKSQPNN